MKALVPIVVACAALLVPGSAVAAAGDLDPSFSGDGIVRSTHAYQGSWEEPIAIDSQDRIVVASETAIERYMANGAPDASFSGDGHLDAPCALVQSIAIDSQDRIVVAGYANNPADPRHRVFAIGRVTVNGNRDPSFSGDGCAFTQIGGVRPDEAHAVTIDAQGRIVAAGQSLHRDPGPGDHFSDFFAVARYLPNGSPDTSFSGDGQLQTEFPDVSYAVGEAIAIDSGGRIVVAGVSDNTGSGMSFRFAVARYGPRGGLDRSFSGDGTVTTAVAPRGSRGETVAIDDSDRIVVGGTASTGDRSYLALARYRLNGALDVSFSGDGKQLTSFGRDRAGASGLAIDDQGRIVAPGWTFDENNLRSAFAVARYTAAGLLDPAFSGDGRVTTPMSGFAYTGGVALDSAGRIVVGGSTSNASLSDPRITVARYLGG